MTEIQPYTANTTCDIYRYNHSPPANPDVSAVQIQLRPDFLSSHLAAIGSGSIMRWTHIALMPLGTDVRDGYSPGANAGLSPLRACYEQVALTSDSFSVEWAKGLFPPRHSAIVHASE